MKPVFLQARTTDPMTSHVAMTQVKEGKIIAFANGISQMLDQQAARWKDDEGSGAHLAGLTDWQMTELFVDTSNKTTGYLDWLRSEYQMTGANNAGGFIRMGRKWLVDNGYVIDSGWTRPNKYLTSGGEKRAARRGTVWHKPATPVRPPSSDDRSRAQLVERIVELEQELRRHGVQP